MQPAATQANGLASNPDELRAVLNADPVWSAYAIADLQPAYAPYSRWYTGRSAAGSGVVLLFTRLTPPALFAAGDIEAVAAAMAASAMLDTVYMTLRAEHVPAAERYYDFSADVRPMWRMALVDADARSDGHERSRRYCEGFAGEANVVRLTPAHSARIRELIAHGGPFAPDAFEPYQAEDGVFYGVEDAHGELVAVGGTHVADWQAGVAAIGNMYTHPAQRGQGFGGAVLRAILADLAAGGVSNIILNVDQRNGAAKRLYERHGFVVHCPYLEGVGHRRI